MSARLALAGVVLTGAALRFYPIWFGLGYAQARPDETTTLGTAVAILSGDPNPHFFHWPSLTFYLFAGLFAAVPTLDHGHYVLIARGAVACAGTLTIVLLARMTRTIANRSTAIVAAAFLSVAVLHVRESHFAMTDVLMTMWATACLLVLIEGRGWTAMAIAGIAGGLATSTKYSAAPLMLSGLVVPGARWQDRAVFAGAFACAFVAASPYVLVDFATFRADVSFEGAHLAAGHVGEDLGRGWTYHLTRSLPYGLGLPVYLAGLAGIPILVRRHARAAVPLLAFAVPFYIAIGSGRTVFFRYILPVVPLFCVSAGLAVRALVDSTALPLRVRPRAAMAALTALLAFVPLVTSARMDRLLARTDSRVLAAEWLIPRLRPEHTLHDAGGDYTRLALGPARFHEWRYDPASRSFGAGAALPDWIVLPDSPLREYATVPESLRDLVRERYALAYEVRAASEVTAGVFDRHDAFFLPIAGFGGVERPGPNVQIYFQRR